LTALRLSAQQMVAAQFVVAVAGVVGGTIAWAAGASDAASAIWIGTTLWALVPSTIDVAKQIWRMEPGVDVIAILAMAGALAYGEFAAGAVIAVMLTTGVALEAYAARRAERDLSGLLERTPRVAHRIVDGDMTTIPADDVAIGDRLLVKEADLVPVDGVVDGGAAVLDESALTGESMLVTREDGARVSSGVVNAGPAFHMVAEAAAAESTYAGIVRLVEQARRSRAPFVRLADRYAAIFVPVTLGVAALAWVISGEPSRSLAVLVVATPCPLLLGAPIAIVAGLSRAARAGIIVKGGATLEALARAETVLLDKTGTLTGGRPVVRRVILATADLKEDEVLQLAASLDQASSHVLAAALVDAARQRQLPLLMPSDVREAAGSGIEGTVGGRQVVAGQPRWVLDTSRVPGGRREAPALQRRLQRYGGTTIAVAVDGRLAGAIQLEDPLRPDAPRTLRGLKALGIRNTVMVTGDHATVAEAIAAAAGIDHVLAERSPEEKVEAVRASQQARLTVMVGDGINDAPALATADVGVAMGARGATASSEAADVVLVRDRLDGLVDVMRIAKRSRRVALESVLVGMGLSFFAMGVAAFGYLPPVAGALAQEGIDVLAILIALRALGSDGRHEHLPAIPDALATRLHAEHQDLIPRLGLLRETADRLPDLPPLEAKRELEQALRFFQEEVLPHERTDERDLYPEIARLMRDGEVLATMSRSHAEIFHLGRQLALLVEALPDDGVLPEDLPDLYRTLYALDAVLHLHFGQEEDLYARLDEHYMERGSVGATSLAPARR